MALIGICAGTLGSLIGVGGGIVITPILTFIGLPPAVVASTSLYAVVSTSLSASISYFRQKKIIYELALKLSFTSIPGSVAGVFISSFIPTDSFKILFALILVTSGVYILYKKSMTSKDKENRKIDLFDILLFFSLSFLAGVISSLFGVGGGIIFVPIMIIILNVSMYYTSATSQFALLLTSVTGLLVHSYFGHPNLLYALPLSIGAFLGGQIGSHLINKVNEKILRKLLSLTLFIVAIRLSLDALNVNF